MKNTIQQIQNKFIEKKLTLAVAESLTGGTIQSLFTSISGSSAYFAGGLTAYNIDQKVNHLNVNRSHAEACNCVSLETAREMAIGITELMNSDYGIATTGYVSPTDDIPEAHAFICVYRRSDNSNFVFKSRNLNYTDRVSSQKYFAETAISALSEFIKDI